jgi:hypothetical protein
MSTVTVTDLVPGTEATSTGPNATITSFNAATAAGQIGATNIRTEGVDRWVLNPATNVVEMDTESAEFSVAAASNLINSVAYAVVPLAGGASPMVTAAGVVVPSAPAAPIVHASVVVYNVTALFAGTYPEVWLRIERSTDGGGVWAPVTGTERHYKMRLTGILCSVNLTTDIPAIYRTVMWVVYDAGGIGNTTLWRVVYRTLNGSFTFENGHISPQVLLR